MFNGGQNLGNANATFARVIENPCTRVQELFSLQDGSIQGIDVLIRQASAEGKKLIHYSIF